MKPIAAFLLIVLFLVVCGCSEAPSVQAAETPATTPGTPQATVMPLKTTLTSNVIIPSRSASVSDNTIIISKNTFRPANITVRAGSTVRWVNADDHPHRIEFMDKVFSTSTYLLGSSQSASQRFDREGRYDFACMIHPEMQGSVLVEK